MRTQRSLAWGALLLALPLAVAACSTQPAKSELSAAMSPGEQSCAAKAAESAGVDPASVKVTHTTSTTNGASVYVAETAGASYMCVIEPDQRMSSFQQQK